MNMFNSQNREKLVDSEMRFVRKENSTHIILRDQDTGIYELWTQNDDYAGYVIEIDGIGYEFVRNLEN